MRRVQMGSCIRRRPGDGWVRIDSTLLVGIHRAGVATRSQHPYAMVYSISIDGVEPGSPPF
jgi:hypothetical protein